MCLSGIKVIWKLHSLKAQAMSTTQGDVSSPRAMICVEDKPDHLLVLVHGIMGRYTNFVHGIRKLELHYLEDVWIDIESHGVVFDVLKSIIGALVNIMWIN